MMDTSKVPHKKVILPDKYIKGASDIYYITRYPEGDAHIHVSYPRAKDGYGGRVIAFLMEDGTIETVKGPYCLDGMFDMGDSKMLADALNDPTISHKAYKLTVGKNLRMLYFPTPKDPEDIVYQEKDFILGDPDERIKPEWEGMECAIEGRGVVSYRMIKDGKIASKVGHV